MINQSNYYKKYIYTSKEENKKSAKEKMKKKKTNPFYIARQIMFINELKAIKAIAA